MVGIAYQTCVEASLNSVYIIIAGIWDGGVSFCYEKIMPDLQTAITGILKAGGKE